jgi:hypothetical protein
LTAGVAFNAEFSSETISGLMGSGAGCGGGGVESAGDVCKFAKFADLTGGGSEASLNGSSPFARLAAAAALARIAFARQAAILAAVRALPPLAPRMRICSLVFMVWPVSPVSQHKPTTKKGGVLFSVCRLARRGEPVGGHPLRAR